MKEPFLDDATMNRMLNALLMMFLANGIWGWLMDFGEISSLPFNPINIVIAVGVISLVFDLKDYANMPRPKSLLVGTLLLPLWLVVRFWIVKK